MENRHVKPADPANIIAEPIPLTLEAIYQEKIFEASSLRQPHWMRKGRHFSYLDKAPDGDLTAVWMYDVDTGTRTAITDAKSLQLPAPQRPKKTDLAEVKEESKEETDEDADEDGGAKEAGDPNVPAIHGYQWSPDETRILFAHIPHRRSSTGDKGLTVYTVATKHLARVSVSEQDHHNAKWSPDGRSLGYVRGDEIYVLNLETGKETRLTNTAQSAVYNGRFGWVYEEELNLVDGWAWSPDGRKIAYFHVDETHVPVIDLPNYDDLHMKPTVTRYPKAGDPNPLVKIGVIDLHAHNAPSGHENEIPPTLWIDLGADTDIYISRMQWTPSGELLLHRIPRLQNRIELLKADLATGKTHVILVEEDRAWVDVRGDLTFVGNSNEFFWLSDRDGYKHLYLYDLTGKLIRQLTHGAWDVDELAGVDATHRMAYFSAARPTPMERQLFSVLLDGGGDIIQLSDAPGQHKTLFSPDAEYYLDTYSNRATPPRTRLVHASGQPLAVVHANSLVEREKVKLGEWEFTTFKTPDGVTLNAAMLKPQDFDPNKKYPVLMYTYGGPGSQVVLDAYGSGGGLEQLLASKGYLFVMVDGRGSGMRGRDFMKITYQNLGHYEVEDQIAGAKWLGSLPYVDADRIGIWGWSYGGYMASLCILRGADVFRTAVAVAPVTHWAFYDTIYTERYMRRPKDNPENYETSSPLMYAEKLKGKFLLVHGTADDNVHFQNSARLAEEFQKLNKPFRMMAYPGKHHGIEGVSLHLFTMLTDFIVENL